jgi:hypothetical protein
LRRTRFALSFAEWFGFGRTAFVVVLHRCKCRSGASGWQRL